MKVISNFFYFPLALFLTQIYFISTGSIFDYSHMEGSQLNIIAGKLSSNKYIIPFAYTQLNICNSSKIVNTEDTIGEILTGEELFTTGHEASTNINKYCQTLCYNKFDKESIERIKSLIKREYFLNIYLDKLPVGLMNFNTRSYQTLIDYFKGVPLGFRTDKDSYFIYNHFQFHILLNKINEKKFNIVGFNILPMSLKHDKDKPTCSKSGGNDLLKNFDLPSQSLDEEEILFTYDTIFEYSNITWASRWDHYKTVNTGIHWAGIILSNVIIIIFAFFIYIVLSRSLQKDIDYYNYQVSNLEVIDDYGWKQISGDVFRAPKVNKMLLSSLVGIGVQLFFMVGISLCFGSFGFLHPEKRAKIIKVAITLYCFMGLTSGYMSTVLYRYFGGKELIKNILLTGFLFPGTLMLGYFVVNIILSLEKSNASVSVFDIISFFTLWIICTFPFLLIGCFLGIKGYLIKIPTKINPIPSVIPEKPFYLRYKFLSFITGLICFATIFIELSYVMASLWKHQIYFLAAFLWLSFLIYVIVSGELSIIVVYLNLCYGDYKWWWKSFIIGASPAIYFFIYSIYYFFNLKLTRLSAIAVYFGIMGLISSMALCIGGSASLLITFGFLNKIYSIIKID